MKVRRAISVLAVILAAVCLGATVSVWPESTQKPRARDIGVPFDGAPGPLNAITDVAGVEVGHTTPKE